MTIASKLQNKAAWGEERYARFAKLLQYCLSGYIKKGLNMSSAVVGGLTKVLYKVRMRNKGGDKKSVSILQRLPVPFLTAGPLTSL